MPQYGIIRWEHSAYTRGVLFFNEGKAFDFSWYGPMIAVSTSLESSSIIMDVLDITPSSTIGGGTEQHRSPPASKDITNRITDQFLLLGYLILTQKKKQNTKGHGMPPRSSMRGSNNQGCPLSCTKATFAKTSSTLVHTYKHNPPPNSWMG